MAVVDEVIEVTVEPHEHSCTPTQTWSSIQLYSKSSAGNSLWIFQYVSHCDVWAVVHCIDITTSKQTRVNNVMAKMVTPIPNTERKWMAPCGPLIYRHWFPRDLIHYNIVCMNWNIGHLTNYVELKNKTALLCQKHVVYKACCCCLDRLPPSSWTQLTAAWLWQNICNALYCDSYRGEGYLSLRGLN